MFQSYKKDLLFAWTIPSLGVYRKFQGAAIYFLEFPLGNMPYAVLASEPLPKFFYFILFFYKKMVKTKWRPNFLENNEIFVE